LVVVEVVSLEDFVRLCRDASLLVDRLRSKREFKNVKLKTLMPATVYFLARKRGLRVTLHQLCMIYGVTTPSIIRTRRRVEKAVESDEKAMEWLVSV